MGSHIFLKILFGLIYNYNWYNLQTREQGSNSKNFILQFRINVPLAALKATWNSNALQKMMYFLILLSELLTKMQQIDFIMKAGKIYFLKGEFL